MVEKSCYTCVQGDSEICIDIYLLKDVNKLKNKTLSLFLSHRVHYSKINITYLLEHVISNPNFCFRFLRKIYTGNLFIHFAGISLEVMTRISELACTFARKIDRFRGATWNGNESRIVERVSRFDTFLSPSARQPSLSLLTAHARLLFSFYSDFAIRQSHGARTSLTVA